MAKLSRLSALTSIELRPRVALPWLSR